MNKSYTVVWNESKGCWSVAGESAKHRGKSSVGGVRVVAAALVVAGLMALIPVANALPTGAKVTHGTASVFSADGKNLVINQSTPKAVINWKAFGVETNETVTFNQRPTDMTLNQVAFGGAQTAINGKITAPGKIFIVNPSGVVFNSLASVNVGSLVASTQPVDPAHFYTNTSGAYVFEGGGSGAVVNNGEIFAGDGGDVVLLGRYVSNRGAIRTNGGTTALGAGKKFTVTIGSGLLKLQVNAADANAVAENMGSIRADGGQVLLRARADGAANMVHTVVNNAGVIEANTLNGTRGRIVLDGGSRGVVEVAGRLSASALTGHGNGGTVDAKGRTVQVRLSTEVDTRSNSGATGTFKVSSQNVNVENTTVIAQPTIYADTLNANLATTNIELAATKGNVVVNAAVDWKSDHRLTLNAKSGNSGVTRINGMVNAWGSKAALSLLADERIELNNRVFVRGAGASLNVQTTTAAAGSGGAPNKPALANLVLSPGQQSAVTLGVGASYVSNGIAHTVIHNQYQLQSITNNLNGYYVLGNGVLGTFFNSIGGSGTFGGVFDGLGHTLKGFAVINGGSNVGLFAASSGVIRNVALDGVYISPGNANAANMSIGALVGYNSGVITNVSVKNGHVNGNKDRSNIVGGLVGTNSGGTIDRAVFSGVVSSGASTHTMGGLVGLNTLNINGEKGRILNSQSHGTVKGDLQRSYEGGMGGLVGVSRYGDILDSASTANVATSSAHVNVGGLVGYAQNSALTNVASTGGVSAGPSSNVGGLIGLSENSTVTHARSSGKVKSENGANTGGLVGVNKGGTIGESESTGAVLSENGLNTGGLVGLNSDRGQLINVSASGSVHDAATAAYIGGLVGTNGWASTIVDSEAKGARVSTTRSAAGTAIGGLVGYNSGDVSYSLSRVADVFAGDSAAVGGLVGHNTGTLSETRSISNVEGGNSSNVGGLVGINAGEVSGNAMGNVYGTHSSILGGLVGQNQAGATIKHSSASGLVGGSRDTIIYNVAMGGLVGINEGMVHSSTTSSQVSTRYHQNSTIGGLVGKNYGTFKGNTTTGQASTINAAGVNQGTID
ncbi:filamentous hemagglutinin N-terminal domain-containing protein [Achromobacter seleniivolatilans]|uniref:Filamentous hemagglutinin N-terminal domain-containing protein n=1 Tax=Achromobacter seleniivolatilans TaxID=3047478 RepID=A0ABY9LWB6_9BURK|nr:GLUG motif-containing protein [Achromobacter sp. R39]WMD19074.1 filamentous hemagglutinin N-terminal domain-containing protein [Achromobacter sp. R39]